MGGGHRRRAIKDDFLIKTTQEKSFSRTASSALNADTCLLHFKRN